MSREPREDKENKAYLSFRAATDLSMGVLYVVVSLYALYFPWVLKQFGKISTYVFVGLFVAYGCFRIVRGVMGLKNSLRK